MVERRSRKDFVRCPESGSVRFSEVANVLQLWYFQSVTRQVSVVAWVSASRRVRYGRFHCTTKEYVIPGPTIACVEALWNNGLLYQHSRNSHCLRNVVVLHDELMYVWDKTHITNNIVIMTTFILQ